MAKLREEMIVRSYDRSYGTNIEEQVVEGFGIGGSVRKMEEKEKRGLEKKIFDLTKSNRQLSQ